MAGVSDVRFYPPTRRNLKGSIRKFKDGDVIYSEADPSDSVFVITDGEVEVSETGGEGQAQLSLLKRGDMFGERGLESGAPRGGVAQALGDVSVRVIPRMEYMAAMNIAPEPPSKFEGGFFEGLKKLLLGPALSSSPQGLKKEDGPVRSTGEPGVLARLMGAFGKSRHNPLYVRVAPLSGENGAEQTRQLMAVLKGLDGIRARTLNRPLDDHDPVSLRALMAANEDDLFIEAQNSPGETALYLRFYPAEEENEDRPGAFPKTAFLPLAGGNKEESFALLLAVILAAAPQFEGGKAVTVEVLLPEAVKAAQPLAQHLPVELTALERANLLFCLANALTAAARSPGHENLLADAVPIYRQALEILPREEAPVDWGFGQKNLGCAIQILIEQNNDYEGLEKALDAYGAAAKVLHNKGCPLAWASAQNRLGTMLYR
ncbi:MAG TPA: cyclic nucleotide-binding domain-containing protein, partial [Rhodospirillales bacterium]|nr:cyclic nucleotide-binding domain-containing protein [Rhodospirillales bacterium]